MKLFLATALAAAISCTAPPGPPPPAPRPPGPKQPWQTQPPKLPRLVPVTRSADIHLTCPASDPTQHADLRIDMRADRVDTCTVSPQDVTMVLEATGSPSDQITVHIAGYAGPGVFTMDDSNARYVSVTGGGPSSPSVMTPKKSCTGCTVGVSEAPGAFPKDVTFDIDCPSLCQEDTNTCGPLRLKLQVPCTHS